MNVILIFHSRSQCFNYTYLYTYTYYTYGLREHGCDFLHAIMRKYWGQMVIRKTLNIATSPSFNISAEATPTNKSANTIHCLLNDIYTYAIFTNNEFYCW